MPVDLESCFAPALRCARCAAGIAADQPAAPAAPARARNCRSFMVPIKPDAAEAYWAPDSRHLIAQTKDPQAIPEPARRQGSLT